jgi:hypothetical protein
VGVGASVPCGFVLRITISHITCVLDIDISIGQAGWVHPFEISVDEA